MNRSSRELSTDTCAAPLASEQAGQLPPTYDGSKSLGERLYEACHGDEGPNFLAWDELVDVSRTFYEKAAVNFVSRLSGVRGAAE